MAKNFHERFDEAKAELEKHCGSEQLLKLGYMQSNLDHAAQWIARLQGKIAVLEQESDLEKDVSVVVYHHGGIVFGVWVFQDEEKAELWGKCQRRLHRCLDEEVHVETVSISHMAEWFKKQSKAEESFERSYSS